MFLCQCLDMFSIQLMNVSLMGFPGGSEVKASACNERDLGSIPGLERSPGEGNDIPHPTPVFLPGESHGRRSLAGYSPWGLKGSDTTEGLHFHGCDRNEITK